MTKIKYFFATILLVVVSSSYGQSSNEAFKPKIIPSLMLGVNVPFGAYATQDIERDYGFASGFADPGLMSEFGLFFQVRPSFGLTVNFNYLSNPVNVQRLGDYMDYYLNAYYQGDYQYRIKAGSWSGNSFLLGIAYRSPEKRASVELDFRFGFFTSRSPNVSIDSIDNTGALHSFINHKSESNFHLALSPGLKFKIQIIDNLQFDIATSIFLSGANLSERIYPEDYPYYSGNIDKNNILTFNLLGGLSYEIDW